MTKLNFKIISLIALLTFAFTSCSNDEGYSLDKFWVDLATVEPIDENFYYLKLDDGTKLWVAASSAYIVPKYSRAKVNYTILSDAIDSYADGYDHQVKVNYIQYILTKDVIELNEANEDSIGNDPIKILELWEGDDFLNIHFGYNMAGQKVHFVNLVQNSVNEQTEQNGAIELEFRHNANNDPTHYGVTGLVAFDLRPFKVAGKESIDFVIKVKDFDTVKQYKLTYKYTTQNGKSSSNKRTLPETSSDIRYE